MDSRQLLGLLAHVHGFEGVYSRNTLPTQVTYPCALICNTDRASGPGQHWVAMYLNSEHDGEYFDSYGLKPLHKSMQNFMNRMCTGWIYNKQRLQGSDSRVCGHYCTVYLWCKAHGHSMAGLVKLFGADLRQNDAMVKNYVQDVMMKGSLASC